MQLELILQYTQMNEVLAFCFIKGLFKVDENRLITQYSSNFSLIHQFIQQNTNHHE